MMSHIRCVRHVHGNHVGTMLSWGGGGVRCACIDEGVIMGDVMR